MFSVNSKIQTYAADRAIQKYGGFYETYPGARSLVGNNDYPQDVPIQPNPDDDVKDMMPPTWYDGCYTNFGSDELVLKNIKGVKVEMINNIIGHQPFGLFLDIDTSVYKTTNSEFVEILKNSTPSIWTRVPDGEKSILIHVFGMNNEQSNIVGEVIKNELNGLKV